ncbi:hypothetical protein A3E10_01140 [Candidatus Roizmanbacteria bacterium RIFCSPHIGHO2_12_FULL_37_23]|nr:MAG: hypothetical protein A3E10_01140 [Candidatus Roizmanbacteria bacterium RIFCSPHIGHO2_12_FULL_37_23]
MKNKNTFLYGVIGLLLGVVITGYLASSAVNTNNTGMMQIMGMNTSEGGSGITSNIDKHFIEEMIPHHEGAIEMARLAQDRATQPEIKTLAASIITSQSEEIKLMKSWYKDWYGIAVPEEEDRTMGMGRGMMHGGMMGDTTDTESLKNAEDFDKAFIEEMIPHHQMAVMMSNMLAKGTRREEMKKLAQNIIDAQTKEINDMRTWYEVWGY